MNLRLIKKEWREARWLGLAGLVVLIVTAAMTVFSYDFIVKMLSGAPVPGSLLEQMQNLLRNYPLYVWGNWYSKNLYQIGSLFAVLFGMGLISHEVSRGTVDFLLSKPVRRRDVLGAKYLAGASYLLGIAVVSTVSLIAMTGLAGKPVPAGWFLLGLPGALAGLLLIFAIAAFYSVVLDDRVKGAVAAFGTILAMAVPGWFPAWRKWSVFYHMAGGEALLSGGVPWGSVSGVIIIVAILYLATARILDRKEF